MVFEALGEEPDGVVALGLGGHAVAAGNLTISTPRLSDAQEARPVRRATGVGWRAPRGAQAGLPAGFEVGRASAVGKSSVVVRPHVTGLDRSQA